MSATSRHFKLIDGLDQDQIGHEARAHADDHMDLKIWLRLLACSTQSEQQIRQHLRDHFLVAIHALHLIERAFIMR